MPALLTVVIILGIVALILGAASVRVIKQYENGVLFRLGMKRAMARQAEAEREKRAKIMSTISERGNFLAGEAAAADQPPDSRPAPVPSPQPASAIPTNGRHDLAKR